MALPPASDLRYDAGSMRDAEGRDLTVNSLIQRIRPAWLRPRSLGASGPRAVPNVFVDNLYVGGPEALQSLRPGDVEAIEYLSPRESSTRFGTRFPGAGAIFVSGR